MTDRSVLLLKIRIFLKKLFSSSKKARTGKEKNATRRRFCGSIQDNAKPNARNNRAFAAVARHFKKRRKP